MDLSKKLKEVEKELSRGKIIQRSMEKRKRKNRKRIRDFKSSEEGRYKRKMRWQGKEQDASLNLYADNVIKG